MASAQEPCLVRILVERKSGFREVLHEGRVELWGQGGSQDGSIATATSQDLKATLPLSPIRCNGGDKIIVSAKLDASDGLDASDAVWEIPIIKNGVKTYLVRSDLVFTTDYPTTTPASVWLDMGTGYEVPKGSTVFVGGGKIFLSIEDDA